MGRQQKSPAMPLYGKDAWTDEEFAARPWDVQGLFWRLAFWQWMEGSIPADVAKIVAVVGKPRETKRLFAILTRDEFFVPHPKERDRLYNTRTDEHRTEMLKNRDKKQVGAEITNAKRNAKRTGERTAERDATRDASADAIVLTSHLPENRGEGVGEGPELTPQQDAVKRVLDSLEENTTGFLLPTGGLVARWIRDFGLDDTIAAIVDEGHRGNLDGRDPSYLFKCIESRKRRPNVITRGNNHGTDRRTTPNEAGAGAKPVIERARFPHRTAAEVLGDGIVHPVQKGVAGGSTDPVR